MINNNGKKDAFMRKEKSKFKIVVQSRILIKEKENLLKDKKEKI